MLKLDSEGMIFGCPQGMIHDSRAKAINTATVAGNTGVPGTDTAISAGHGYVTAEEITVSQGAVCSGQ